MNLRDGDMCSSYDPSPETIYHAFITCPRASGLWYEIEEWLREKTRNNVNVSDIEKILGRDEKKPIVRKATLATKGMIYNNRERKRLFNINAVKKVV